jgi:hypothetical protein
MRVAIVTPKQRHRSFHVALECLAQHFLDCQFVAGRRFWLAVLGVLSSFAQDIVDDFSLDEWTALRTSLRVGVVANLKARMFWRLSVADFIVTHRLYP